MRERVHCYDKHQQRLWEIQNKPRAGAVLAQVTDHSVKQEMQRKKAKLEYATQRKNLSVNFFQLSR